MADGVRVSPAELDAVNRIGELLAEQNAALEAKDWQRLHAVQYLLDFAKSELVSAVADNNPQVIAAGNLSEHVAQARGRADG